MKPSPSTIRSSADKNRSSARLAWALGALAILVYVAGLFIKR